MENMSESCDIEELPESMSQIKFDLIDQYQQKDMRKILKGGFL